jgi:DNA-binding HxlR family transcriptional regulator
MRRTSFAGMNCSVAGALEILGEWWTMLIVRDAFMGVRRFEDFQRRLGIARNVLTTRLQKLVAAGILERRRYQERPERFEYRLTAKGIELYPILVSLMQWGDRWAPAETKGPPVVLIHRECGHESRPHLVCDHCGAPADPRQMVPVAGPGYDDREELAPHLHPRPPVATRRSGT